MNDNKVELPRGGVSAVALSVSSRLAALDDIATGQFAVCTYSGAVYVLDLDERTALRVVTDDTASPPSTGVFMKLITVVDCQVGACMRLRVELVVGTMLYRDLTSTPVLKIVELAPEVAGL